MRAEVKKMGDVTVISIVGTLPIEATQAFRDACKQATLGSKIVFNMSGARFIGSTGLQPFMEAVTAVDQAGEFGLKMVGAKPEFRRLFSSMENARLEYFEDLASAMGAFAKTASFPVVAKTIQFQIFDEDQSIDD